MPKGVYKHKTTQGFKKGNIPWSKDKIGKDSAHWKGGKVKFICIICKKEKHIHKCWIKRGGGKYCSLKCYGIWRSKNIRGDKNYQWKGGLIKRICPICNKEKFIYPSRVERNKNICCSTKCMGIFNSQNKKNNNNPNWKGGLSFEPYTTSWTNDLKESIRKRDNNNCQLCDKNQIEFRKKLSIHHIDYNKKNCDPKNLITLCCNCHNKTLSKREYWQKYLSKNWRVKWNR